MLPPWVAEERRRKRETLAAIRAGIRDSDLAVFYPALVQLDHICEWRAAMLAIRRCRPPSAAFRRGFRDHVWLRSGDHIRGEVGDDLLLVDALRVLMPPYRGPALRLWRGEGFWNRRRRTYGMSWTRDRGIADAFALSRAACIKTGRSCSRPTCRARRSSAQSRRPATVTANVRSWSTGGAWRREDGRAPPSAIALVAGLTSVRVVEREGE